ncbi:NUDIX domain-containing protein [Actinospica durhamensis]|uniref:NUDIX domain-containing protein n=1 Tax=Actinospica durhamensis TaxID=1508375 RepID=A0A941F0D7_9ACTN|nr:NUDIX domain-containing protein [Actinospica durhamensis]MBR7839049.1 NUDIX domain-containing protein [Actinospica durhamensis]
MSTLNTQRQMIAQTVASLEAVDALEGDHQSAVLDWIASGDELYRLVPPDYPPRHLVSYFVPFDPARGRVLLAAHRKSGLMLPPGGHCESGELPWQTVRRECVEELGVPAVALAQLGPEPLFVTVTETRGPMVRRHTDVSLWYVIELDHADERLRPDPGEFDGVRWYSLDELLVGPIEEFDPHTHRFVRKLNNLNNLSS